MDNVVLINILQMINIVICISMVFLVIWQSVVKKTNTFIVSFIVVLLFLFLFFEFLTDTKFDVYVQFFSLLVILYLLISHFLLLTKNSKSLKYLKQNNNLKLISETQERERSRIYANLHDDVGAKLLELIYCAKDDDSKRIAQEVLKKIRHSVASTQNVVSTIEQLIKEIVVESQSRLAVAGIKQIQNISLVNGGKKLAIITPSVISRIIREVVSNIVKHSQATHVDVRVASTNNQLTIIFHDNGIGFCEKNQSGKGLNTIKKRAESIAAEVKWHSQSDDGCSFMLSYKL